MKVGRVANLGTLLVLCIIAYLSLSVGTTLSTYIGLSRFWSVEHYHLLAISCIHWIQFQHLASIWKQVPVSSCKSNPFDHSQPHSACTHVHLFALLLITGRAASILNAPPQLSIKSSASSLIPRPMRGSASFSTVGPTGFVNASALLIAVGTYSTLTIPHLTRY
jgi:hypothetical protein